MEDESIEVRKERNGKEELMEGRNKNGRRRREELREEDRKRRECGTKEKIDNMKGGNKDGREAGREKHKRK